MANWRIYERDVDIVLGEEFYANAEFSAWVLKRTKFANDAEAEVVEVNVSLSDVDGESDLVVIAQRADKSRIALLIEDKIDATFQPSQLHRYRLRGQSGVAAKNWCDFVVLLCAPRAYIERSLISKEFDATLPYEDIADFMRKMLPGLRGEYRADFFGSAAPRGASAYIKIKDEATDKFWQAAYALASREFPAHEMRAPDYAKNANWVSFKPGGFPAGLRLDLKGNTGFVDLTFDRIHRDSLERLAGKLIESDMLIHQTGNSSAVGVRIDRLHVSDGLAAVENEGSRSV